MVVEEDKRNAGGRKEEFTGNERRIVENLRKYAKNFPNADLACLITVRNGQIMKGLLCLGKGPDSNIRL